jgi:hypothetical protein
MIPEAVKPMLQLKVTVPIGLLIGILYVGYKADSISLALLDEVFFSEAQGQTISEKVDKIGKEVTELSETVQQFVKVDTIKELNRKIQDTEDQISETNIGIATNGESPAYAARLRDLSMRLDTLTEQKACLLNDNITNKELCDIE